MTRMTWIIVLVIASTGCSGPQPDLSSIVSDSVGGSGDGGGRRN